MGPIYNLCILFLYHKCDELTKFHLSVLCKSNPTAIVVPLTDSVPELLPGSIDVSLFPSLFSDAPKWRSIDATIYRWFRNRKVNARRYLIIEYDCLCNVDLNNYYAEVMSADVAGIDLFTRADNPGWKWFRDEEVNKLPYEDRTFAAGIVPFTCTIFSHEALENIVENVYRQDVFCELRLGTIIRKLGLRFQRLQLLMRSTICWHTYPWKTSRPGLFHSIKTLDHNKGKYRQPGSIGSYIYDLLRSHTHDREFLPFNLHGKRLKLMRVLNISEPSK